MFPVEQCWPQLADHIVEQNVVLSAPPGAGKSTVLPLKLMQLPAFKNKKIIMLQPRQVAVRSIAQRLSKQLNEPVGKTVGYRMRGEQNVSANTRLEIVTEGLLTRMLQNDPELSEVGLVIFDEFHERNVHADFSLALCLESQQGLREDLRLLIMSATLEHQAMLGYLPDAKFLHSEGKSYPIEILYRPFTRQKRLHEAMLGVLREALATHQGNVLAFLPGSADIRRVHELLERELDADTHCFALYSDLTREKQTQALAATRPGERKVVLATNIAETSLTIDGISVVVDSGLEKVLSYDANRQLQSLHTRMISKASSIQRAGRAGRLMAGHCYRLWSSEQQQRLAEHKTAQIQRMEISSLVLEAKVWGSDLSQLPLMDMPSDVQIQHALSLLHWLGALDDKGLVSKKGLSMARLGCHPRVAAMLVEAQEQDGKKAQLACVAAAIIEANSLPGKGIWLDEQLDSLRSQPRHRLWQDAKRWGQRVNVTVDPKRFSADYSSLSELLLASFITTLGKRRERRGFLMFNGTGADFPSHKSGHLHGQASDSVVGKDIDWLVAIRVTGSDKADGVIRLAQKIQSEQVLTQLADKIQHNSRYYWHSDKQSVGVIDERLLGAISLDKTVKPAIEKPKIITVLVEQIRLQGLSDLLSNEALQQWLNRVRLAHKIAPSAWPDLSEEILLDNLDSWLSPYLSDVTSWRQLKNLDWMAIFQSMLDYPQQQKLKLEYPSHFTAPTGQRHRLEYGDQGAKLSIRIQQIYGTSETPEIGDGKVDLQITLLSPAGRPIQTTSDLAGFWQGSYEQVQKEMKGRYPKHYWPDDPANAVATTRTKKNM